MVPAGNFASVIQSRNNVTVQRAIGHLLSDSEITKEDLLEV